MRRANLLVLVFIGLVNGFTPSSTAHADAIRHFESVPCSQWISQTQLTGHPVTCGFVTVPETHARPDGPTIRLAVVRVAASHPGSGFAPVFYLAGGPGGPGITPAWTGANAARIATDRDFITFDQRGVRLSQPNLECTEPVPSSPPGNGLDVTNARRLAAVSACRDRLVGEGVDLAAYNSTESAADIEDIRVALGYDQINLLGISYGTRLALTMMRDFPTSLHSVIIDSVSPLQEDSYLKYPITLDRALHLLFASCAADSPCMNAFPDLQTDFSAVVAQFDITPVTVHAYDSYNRKNITVTVTGDRFVILVHDLLYSRREIGYIPALITEARAGSTQLLTRLVSDDVTGPNGSDGMAYSVRCNEYVPFGDRQRSIDAAQALLPEVRDEYVPRLLTIFDVCANWPTRPPDPQDHTPVVSDIPTLVLASANDPTTPPDFGQHAAETLAHSFFIETPGIGHSVIGNGGLCGMQLALAFLNDPLTMPDTQCTKQLGVTFSITGM